MALTDLTRQDEPRSSLAAREDAVYSDRLSSRSPNVDALDDLDQEEESQFLRTPKRVPVRRSPLPKKTQNQVKKVLIVAVVIIAASSAVLAAYRYGQSAWRFRIDSSDNLEITGVQNAARAQVMDVVGADIGRNIFYVPLDERKKQLEGIPWIESATVMRLLPNRIAIHVQERTPVAFVQIGSKISLIDGNGVVMGLPASRQVKYSFPVIQGITETEPLSSRAASMKIYNRLVRELDSEGAHYSNNLSEVDLGDPEDVKVTANDPGGAVVIHLGSTNFLAGYKLYVAHGAEWRQQFQNLQSVDLRYEGQIIVNPDANHNPPQTAAPKPVPAARRRRK
ncbi:MAG TPA: FtsQ-type POTRA domain-containing protein [Candidatus Angelobacter sp.]|jgi:cell division protein FtsQ|nr:FtsQ-type POTRA domain-containing protein [Candidatus Angelobacter sp.]